MSPDIGVIGLLVSVLLAIKFDSVNWEDPVIRDDVSSDITVCTKKGSHP